MGTAQQINDRLQILEAERLVLTVELRTELLRAAKALLPEAIRQAKPSGRGKNKQPGNASLLRLISRVAMRDVRLDRNKPSKSK